MQGTLIRYKNKGTNDPFIARMFFGILELRNYVLRDNVSRLEFDRLYIPVQENLEEAYDSYLECVGLINSHMAKVESGEIISFQGTNDGIINVDESVDREVSRKIKDFFIKGNIGIKAILPLYRYFGFNVSFLMSKDKTFEKGCKEFLASNEGEKFTELIKMFREGRKWYVNFNDARNKIEHEGFSLPTTKYGRDSTNKVIAVFPLINGLPIPQFLSQMWESLFLFSEDLVVALIGVKLEPPLTLAYIPEEFRDKSMPVRYKIWAEGLSEFLQKQKTEEVK